jgi:hypothetical protein
MKQVILWNAAKRLFFVFLSTPNFRRFYNIAGAVSCRRVSGKTV